jgi:hypothetical protein
LAKTRAACGLHAAATVANNRITGVGSRQAGRWAIEGCLNAIRAHPQFIPAVRAICAASLDVFATASPAERWLLKDEYAASLSLAAVIREALDGRVTAAGITLEAQGNDTASPNRVRRFVQEAMARGLIRIPPGPEIWTQRPLILQPGLLALWTRVAAVDGVCMSRVMPELAGFFERLGEHEVFRRFWAATGLMFLTGGDLVVPEPEVFFLHDRNGGSRLLQCAASAPSGTPARLLDRLSMSRTALAAAMGVSRPHLNLMLRDAEARGLLEAGAKEIRFSPVLSDRYERHHARKFEMARRVVAALGLAPDLPLQA